MTFLRIIFIIIKALYIFFAAKNYKKVISFYIDAI